MSIKSYLFKSTKEVINKISTLESIELSFEGIQSSGIDPTTLTQLESILSGEDCYHIYEKGDYSICHRLEEEGGPIFIRSSAKLIDCLKNLNKSRKQEVLERWCKTREMALYGWTPKKAEHIIDWLIETSTQQLKSQEEIFLFIDLQKPEVNTVP